ncbi:RNA polymerase sigma factor [Sphingobium sp. B8D3D]|uniref:RNA polymerase sigma factor n=1 Tax=Sphingobium sp. B8D3D TaxID=2940587 RepID=UPI0022244AC1|nr:sigma-70 family RNA polymerase sigma factor [Sphingobium sp. B8D3D]MCW2414180.1 RNA polymerase sigma-70 factor (ECF subfamily) [Sphingobium sp. B8D3A]
MAREILPYEGRVRTALARRWRGVVDLEDVLHEAYCRLSSLQSIDHIEQPLSYFHRTAHAAAVDLARRAKSKNVILMTETEWFDVVDEGPLADRVLQARQDLGRVQALLSTLSETCRKVIELRRLEGLSQKETAKRLGVSEHVVENHMVRGLKKMLKTMTDEDAAAERTTGMDVGPQAAPPEQKVREVVRIGKPRPY